MPPFRYSPRSGFSLIELLTAIAVVAVLATIMIPSLSRSRENAMVLKDASNLRQVGLAIQSYVQDNDLQLPGPLYTRQLTHYQKDRFAGHLPGILAEYVGAPEPDNQLRVLDIMEDPVWRQIAADPDAHTATSYYIVQLKPDPDSHKFIKKQSLFGYAGYTGSDNSKLIPARIIDISPSFSLSQIPIITNVNMTELGGLPSHRTRRNVLFLDGRVETFDQSSPQFTEYY